MKECKIFSYICVHCEKGMNFNMSISEKDITTYEDRYKNLLYNKIEKIISMQSEIVKQIGKEGQYVDINTDIPNIGITFNNKLNELSQIFKKAEISMFAEPHEKYDLVDSNFVGDAIIDDMISQLSNATQALVKYASSMSKATEKRTEKVKALEKSGSIKKLFLKIRSFFVPTTVSDLISYSEEEIREVNTHLSEYKGIDENLWKYNLKDNVVQSLVKFINDSQYHDFNIRELLEESVIPTLQKLGLEDAISQLQEELSNTQEQSNFSNNKSWELSPTQKLRIQVSSERVANEYEQNESNTVNKEDEDINK